VLSVEAINIVDEEKFGNSILYRCPEIFSTKIQQSKTESNGNL